MLNYCEVEDIYDRLSYLLETYRFSGINVEYIGLSDKTKRTHEITGWLSIVCEDSLGYVESELDIWTGFSFEKSELVGELVKITANMLSKKYKTFVKLGVK